MKARLPEEFQQKGQGNMQGMLKQARQMQEDMSRLQEELEVREYAGASGGGVVEIRMNGKKQVLSLHIKPEAVDPNDIEMLEDMIAAAVNETGKRIDDIADEEMAKISGGMPALNGLI